MKRLTLILLFLSFPAYVMSFGLPSSYQSQFLRPTTPQEQSYTYDNGNAKITFKSDSKQTSYIQSAAGTTITCTLERNNFTCEIKRAGRVVNGKFMPGQISKLYYQQAASKFKELEGIFNKAKTGKL